MIPGQQKQSRRRSISRTMSMPPPAMPRQCRVGFLGGSGKKAGAALVSSAQLPRHTPYGARRRQATFSYRAAEGDAHIGC